MKRRRRIQDEKESRKRSKVESEEVQLCEYVPKDVALLILSWIYPPDFARLAAEILPRDCVVTAAASNGSSVCFVIGALGSMQVLVFHQSKPTTIKVQNDYRGGFIRGVTISPSTGRIYLKRTGLGLLCIDETMTVNPFHSFISADVEIVATIFGTLTWIIPLELRALITPEDWRGFHDTHIVHLPSIKYDAPVHSICANYRMVYYLKSNYVGRYDLINYKERPGFKVPACGTCYRCQSNSMTCEPTSSILADDAHIWVLRGVAETKSVWCFHLDGTVAHKLPMRSTEVSTGFGFYLGGDLLLEFNPSLVVDSYKI